MDKRDVQETMNILNFKKPLLVLCLFLIGFFAGSVFDNQIAKPAYSALWGGCPQAVGQCPSGLTISKCVQSAEFRVTINGTNIPAGQIFTVDIYPSDGSYTCSDVTCLVRHLGGYKTAGWAGSALWYSFDRIGCSSGACRNDYNVNVYIAASDALPGSEHCKISNPVQSWNQIQNGASRDFTFTFNCTPPAQPPTATPTPTLTPTPTPVVTVTPAATATPTPTPVPTLPPRATPTPTPTITPRPTVTITPALTPAATPTPTPPRIITPSPTPTAFNPAACKCDGIEYTGLFSGQLATITSYARVEGADASRAVVRDQSFFLAEGAETMARIIGRSGPITSVVVPSRQSGTVRFQSRWTFTLPALKPGATYRIWSQVNCQPRLQAFNYGLPPSKAVLAETTEQPQSFIQRVIGFLSGLLGRREPAPETTVSEPGVGTGIITEDPDLTGTRRPLQLGTVYPAKVYEKSCSFIKFRLDR
jgi:hypothetical protein